MVKTGEEIEKDIYKIVRQGVKGQVSGFVYRKDTRPSNRGEYEDVVVSFLSGTDGQIQRGVVVVNAYVPYLMAGGDYPVKDVRRTAGIARLLLDIIESHSHDDYYLTTDRSIDVEEDDWTSRVTLRVKYMYNAV